MTSYAFPPGHGQWYDPFSTAGRQTYWKQMRDEIFSKGADGWWLDAPEPEAFPEHLKRMRLDQPEGLKEDLYQRLLLAGLQATAH